jgi:hypothetical protein
MTDFYLEKRLSRKDLTDLYGVDKSTIENWVKNQNLPLFSITSHSKFIRLKDLIEWERKILSENRSI